MSLWEHFYYSHLTQEETEAGDIDIELWSKEAPKACRNFIQLCLEGNLNSGVFSVGGHFINLKINCVFFYNIGDWC